MRGVAGGFTTIRSAIGIFSLWLFAILVPMVHVWLNHRAVNGKYTRFASTVNRGRGMVRVSDLLIALKDVPDFSTDASVGLIVESPQELKKSVVAAQLLHKKGFGIKKVFVPWSMSLDFCSQTVSLGVEKKIPVERMAKDGRFTESQMKGIDLLVFGFQNSRPGNVLYASTLAQVMRAATLYKKMLVFIDRPQKSLVAQRAQKIVKRFS